MINEKILVPAIFAAFILLEAVTGRFFQKEKGSIFLKAVHHVTF